MGANMKELISIVVIGALVALGRLLVSKDVINLRVIMGRSILGGALGLISYPVAWIVSSWFPLPAAAEFQIMIGLCCAFAAAGTEIFEKAIGALVYKVTGKDING